LLSSTSVVMSTSPLVPGTKTMTIKRSGF
jgi:hypothetical protein